VSTGVAALLVLAAAAGGASERWQRHAPVPEPRTEVAAAVVNASSSSAG
jgi:hypothetical protein